VAVRLPRRLLYRRLVAASSLWASDGGGRRPADIPLLAASISRLCRRAVCRIPYFRCGYFAGRKPFLLRAVRRGYQAGLPRTTCMLAGGRTRIQLSSRQKTSLVTTSRCVRLDLDSPIFVSQFREWCGVFNGLARGKTAMSRQPVSTIFVAAYAEKNCRGNVVKAKIRRAAWRYGQTAPRWRHDAAAAVRKGNALGRLKGWRQYWADMACVSRTAGRRQAVTGGAGAAPATFWRLEGGSRHVTGSGRYWLLQRVLTSIFSLKK